MSIAILLSILLSWFSMPIHTDVSVPVLDKYPNKNLVVTGIGSSVILEVGISINAKNANTFSKIYGIEASDILVQHAYRLMPDYLNYHKPQHVAYEIYHKNPLFEMSDIINAIHEPITFVLASQFPDWVDPDKENYVLLELEQIKKHPLKNHTILIDFIYFGNINIDVIKTKILEINPNYAFRLEKGGHFCEEENAVLAAYLQPKKIMRYIPRHRRSH